MTNKSLELITLGTAAGPAIRSSETGIASAVVVDGKFYMVDFGLGCVRSAHKAGLKGRDFVAGFVTHLHSDHVIEIPAFLHWNWGKPVEGYEHPISFYGPGKDPNHAEGETLSGTTDMVHHFLDANNYDIRIRTIDEARPNMLDLVRVYDIEPAPPRVGEVVEPFKVYEDDRVVVMATLVDHPPVYPALAFRFDTEYGSVTFSGDTHECDSLALLAQGTDVLVHEAVNLTFYEAANYSPAFLSHQAKSHTSPEGAGRVATAAGARHLVLSHLAGVATAEEWHNRAATEFSGPIHVARSGDRFAVSKHVSRV